MKFALLSFQTTKEQETALTMRIVFPSNEFSLIEVKMKDAGWYKKNYSQKHALIKIKSYF
jgi:hypothetical protein